MDQPTPGVQPPSDDIVAVARNDSLRMLIGMTGRCAIGSLRDADGNARQFDCRIQKITPNNIALTVPVSGSVGDWIVAYFDRLGKFEGPIVQTRKGALVMRIVATNDDRALLAGTITWATSGKDDARRFPRMVPEYQESTLSLSANRTVPCLVHNHSIGGAAVFVAVTPPIRAVVKIGQVVARVVRRFGVGFAVEFPALRDSQKIKQELLKPVAPAAPAESGSDEQP